MILCTGTSFLCDKECRNEMSGSAEGRDSNTNYFSAELNLVQAQLNERLALVQLYLALGGGWQQ